MISLSPMPPIIQRKNLPGEANGCSNISSCWESFGNAARQPAPPNAGKLDWLVLIAFPEIDEKPLAIMQTHEPSSRISKPA